MGRRHTNRENQRNTPLPLRSEPVTSPGSGTCERCGASVPLRADNGKPIAHYDQRVPNAHVSLTYCK